MRFIALTLLPVLLLSCRERSSNYQAPVKRQSGQGADQEPGRENPPIKMPYDEEKENEEMEKPVQLPLEQETMEPAKSETPMMNELPLPEKPGQPNLPAFCKDVKAAGDWTSAKAFFNANGKLEYPADAEKNRIVDFSFAGYHYGAEDPPNYPVVATIAAVKGDNTKIIQAAIDELGKKAPDAKGVRGALLLSPGTYNISGSLSIPYSGVVLRGSGRGSDPNKDTIIFATGDTPHQRTVITLGISAAGAWKTSGAAVEVSEDFVPVGARLIPVKDPKAFKAGDLVQVKHPSTKAWIDALGGGGTVKEAHWEPGSTDIIFNRQVVAIDGNNLRLDAPIYNHLDKKLATAVVTKAQVAANIVRESGIENLFVDIQTKGGEDENHAWDAISVNGAQDSWVRGITAKHYGQAGVVTTRATRITVDDVWTSDGVGIRTGGRFYNFNASAFSQLILFKNCHAKDGRHNFISNGVQTTSGIVWHKCTSDGDSASEGHRRWSQGMLFDSIQEKSNQGTINLVNRGDAGTSHGWGSAHSVVWNYSGQSTVQKPPTAQNYFISPVGRQGPQKVLGPGATGFVEIKKGKLSPASLYEAQLCERLQN